MNKCSFQVECVSIEGLVETHTPQFARGNVFNQMLSPQQVLEQDQYKACLREQVHTCTAVQRFDAVVFFIFKLKKLINKYIQKPPSNVLVHAQQATTQNMLATTQQLPRAEFAKASTTHIFLFYCFKSSKVTSFTSSKGISIDFTYQKWFL